MLETLARSQTAPFRMVQRSRVLLLTADGVSNVQIAQLVGVTRQTVLSWRADFADRGLAEFARVRSGRGKKPVIPAATVAQIVEWTLHTKPEGETHWSCRTMAAHAGVSPATVQRIWSARGLKPHRVEKSKLSNDKRFEENSLTWWACT